MEVVFYEKTGCKTNRKQKAMLKAAGVTIQSRNILMQPWTPYRLRSFFGSLAVTEWFNPQAPAVKSGEVKPNAMAKLEALELLSRNPLLIRRPLMETSYAKWTGFDPNQIREELGVELDQRYGEEQLTVEALEGCSR